MLHNPFMRKLIQISEDASTPVHVPLILGNDIFVLTQQDIRKIEDIRLFTISQVMPNGDFKIINPLDVSVSWEQFFQQENFSSHQIVNSLLEILKYRKNFCKQQYSAFNESSPEPMDVSITPVNTVASISQQLTWNNCQNVSTPFPLHYSQGTSTTEIDCTQQMKEGSIRIWNDDKICSQYQNKISYCNKGVNTKEIKNICNEKSNNEPLDARQQLLKKKKLRYSFV